MYRVLFPEGQLECERFEHGDHGIDLFDTSDEVFAFIPYANLHAIIDEEATTDDDDVPSVM